jgi:hypothetical protein
MILIGIMRGIQKPGFLRYPSLLPTDLVKNPVSLSESISFVIDDFSRSPLQ